MMTLRERVQDDGVGMRWFRTAATTVSSFVALASIGWAGFVWLVEPRFYEWADTLVIASTANLIDDLQRAEEHLDRLDAVVLKLEQNIAKLSQAAEQSTAPSWRFDPVETRIGDGVIGGKVIVEAAGSKLRDCGTPVVDLYFINGGDKYHRFVDVSILAEGNRGVALPPRPNRLQKLKYTATIPADDEVTPGRAVGYIAVSYPDQCPAVPLEITNPLPFRILPHE